jgi:hypothetical protein
MRKVYVQDPVTLELIPKEEYRRREPVAPMIMPDIKGYQSMQTGEWISSRSQHREHLKQHRLIEIGNEKQVNKPRGLDRAGIRKAAEQAVMRYWKD